MKLLRMTSADGDRLLVEGDPRVPAEHARLIEEFRRQLDQGMWAAVPTSAQGRREAIVVRDFDEIPPETERVLFFPPAAGG